MDATKPAASVVVGIDGSQAAIGAALWAFDEAACREVPLRLVHVTYVDPATHVAAAGYHLDVEYSEVVLRAASAAIAATGKTVKVDTAVVRGQPMEMLVAESRHAAMVCVGCVGIGRLARAFLGSIAAELATTAHCPVAIIRAPQNQPRPEMGWITVPITDAPDNETVVRHAMEEGRLRRAPVLALGGWHKRRDAAVRDELDPFMRAWQARYPDVHMDLAATPVSAERFLADNDARVELTVIGSRDADQVPVIVGPHRHPILGHVQSSVLVVHP